MNLCHALAVSLCTASLFVSAGVQAHPFKRSIDICHHDNRQGRHCHCSGEIQHQKSGLKQQPDGEWKVEPVDEGCDLSKVSKPLQVVEPVPLITILHKAIRADDFDLARKVILQLDKADLCTPDERGFTPYDLAILVGNDEIEILLLELDAYSCD